MNFISYVASDFFFHILLIVVCRTLIFTYWETPGQSCWDDNAKLKLTQEKEHLINDVPTWLSENWKAMSWPVRMFILKDFEESLD